MSYRQSNIPQLATHDKCTGCGACVSSCSSNSIVMKADSEGFLQPYVSRDSCIYCGKCERSCPIVSPIVLKEEFETQCYAAINKNDAIRMQSSSGGVFFLLAKGVVQKGGVVFGARFDEEWNVVHGFAENLREVKAFMGSKYVQSDIGTSFLDVQRFLQEDRWVLFSGTPCQIVGLKKFLGKEYSKLLLVDIICHGVPSLSENLSCAIMESLCCATPVCCFNIGGNGDMVEHHVNGYLAKEKDAEDLG